MSPGGADQSGQTGEESPAPGARGRKRKSTKTEDESAAAEEEKPKRARRSTAASKKAAAPKPPSMNTIAQMYRYLTGKGYLKDLQSVHELISICGTTDDYYNKVTSGLKPLFSVLQSGSYGELLCPGRDRNSYTMADVIRGNGIFYAALRALNNAKAASDLGKMMLTDIRSMAGLVADPNNEALKSEIEKTLKIKIGEDEPKPRISVFIDEASEVVCESMVQLLNKARSSNMAVTLATQTKADFAVRSKTEHVLGQVTGNCNTIISLRLSDDQSGKMISSILGNAIITQESRTLSFNENPHNDEVNYGGSKTLSAAEAPLITPAMLKRLPPGEFFALLPNSAVVKGKIPMVTAQIDPAPKLHKLTAKPPAKESKDK